MSRIQIDFVRTRALPSVLVQIVLLVLLALLAGAAYRFAILDKAAKQLAQASAETTERRAALEGERPAPAVYVAPERRAAVSVAVSELNIRWPALLDALERSKPPAAVLLHVEPRSKERALLITVQAPSADMLVDFMDALATAPPFVRVTPLAQEPQAEGDGLSLQGSFLAYWQEQDQQALAGNEVDKP